MSDRKYISKVISNGETYHVKDKEIRDSLGQVNGIATLGSDGKVSPSQLPTDIDTTYQFSQSGNSLQVGVNGGAKDTVYTPTITKSTVGLDNVTNDAQVKRTEMGAASGVATLDDNGKVPASQLPSYVDDVLEYTDRSSFPQTGETGKIYVDKSTNITWRWGGSDYVEISPSLALGETSSTAYAGDKGKALADKLSGIESGAQVHRAPTTAEVKNALGTGSGTIKYLREDGTWATPPNSQYSFVDKDTTLDWGTRSTVATAGDVDIHVTMPSNPNTNTARLQVSDTANKRINTKESTGNYLQFTGGTNKFSVSDGTNTFDVGITPSVSFPVTSVVGQTGEVTVSQIASALTGAGYKLTDTIYSLPAAASNTLGGIKTGYTTDARNYKVSLDSSSNAYVNVPWSDTTYSAGTGISLSGTTFGINSTYQDYISHGNTAYGWGNHANAGYASASSLGNYLPLSGGTISGASEAPLTISTSTGYSAIVFRSTNGYRIFGIKGDGNLFVTPYSNWNDEYTIYHRGNLTNISQLTNDSGYITSSGSCAKASEALYLLTNNTGQAADDCYDERAGLRFWRYNGVSSTTGQSGGDGWILSWSWGEGSVGGQIYLDDNPSKTICIRGRNGDSAKTFTTWSTVLHTGNSSVSKSGETLTVDIGGTSQSLTNTWRGIQNNLTSTSTTDSLSAYQGYLLANGSARDNTKLPLAGGEMTGALRVNHYIFGYNYGHAGGNVPSFVFDKPGSYLTGIGANGESDTIYFSAAGLDDGEAYWVTSHKQNWKFNGTIYQENNAVIHAGNIGSQSVSYATSAGYADSAGSAPASDVYAWAKAATKPSYTLTEISDGELGSKSKFFHRSDRAAIHHELYGSDADYGVVKITHTSDEGSGGPGAFTASLGIYDERANNISGNYQPTFYINRIGATRTPDLMGCDVGGTRVFTIDSLGNFVVSGYGRFGGSNGVYIGATYAGGSNGFDCIERAGSGNTLYMQYYHAGGISMCNGGGNVMIGSGSPSYKLHVVGDIYATGDIMSQSALTVTSGNDNKIILDNTDSETYWSFISFRDHGSEYGYLGTRGSTDLVWNGNVVIHSGNITSQYVSHADSAGSVDWSNVSGRPSSMPASDVYSWAKASSKPSYSWSEISDRPSSMPASDVYSWAKASSKPSYSWSEITDKPTIPSTGEINYYSYSGTINPSYGLNVLVKISSTGGSIYLPTLGSCQTYTGTSGSQKFALIVRIACHTGGQNFTLYGYRGTGYSQYPHIRSGSTADRTSGVGFGAGDTDTYMLTYDGSLYEAYRLCYTE